MIYIDRHQFFRKISERELSAVIKRSHKEREDKKKVKIELVRMADSLCIKEELPQSLLNNGGRTKRVSRLVHKDPARASASPSVLP